MRPISGSLSLYDQPFSRYCTFYNSPVITNVKNSKFEISQFILTTVVKPYPGLYMKFSQEL